MCYQTVALKKLAKEIEYDPMTGRFLRRNNGAPAFARKDPQGGYRGDFAGKSFKAHRVAWALFYGEWPRGDINHINGDPFDNRITNLRIASNQQKQYNTGSRAGSSIYKGVSWRSDEKCWQVRITINGKLKHLGRFKCEKTAARAYDAAAKEHHGEYARLNFGAA